MKQILFVLVVLLTIPASPSLQKALPQESVPPGETISCRVMETHAAAPQGVTVVVFHQRNKEDGPRLGKLLNEHSEENVQFQTKDGAWHRATVIRLKSCFGRGLLVFLATQAQLAQREEFLLRFSPEATKSK